MRQSTEHLPAGQDPKDLSVFPVVWKKFVKPYGGNLFFCDLPGNFEIVEYKYTKNQIKEGWEQTKKPFEASYRYNFEEEERSFATLKEAKNWLTQVHYERARMFVKPSQLLPVDLNNPPKEPCWWSSPNQNILHIGQFVNKANDLWCIKLAFTESYIYCDPKSLYYMIIEKPVQV